MKISTINPVTIDGKRISKPSKYLSADGGDDYYDADGDDDFYGFDANGKPQTKDETKQFQNWLDVKYPNWLNGGKLNGGYGYGNFGTATTKAWNNYGSEFAKSIGLGTATPTNTTTGSTPAEPTKDEQIAQAKQGKIWDKTKGWITSDKAKDVLRTLLEGGGLMGAINSLLGTGSATPPADSTPSGTPSGTPAPTGMSKVAKIGIAVGIVAVLGIVIYVATRPKK